MENALDYLNQSVIMFKQLPYPLPDLYGVFDNLKSLYESLGDQEKVLEYEREKLQLETELKNLKL